jgi:hypothetical protein
MYHGIIFRNKRVGVILRLWQMMLVHAGQLRGNGFSEAPLWL